MGPIHGIPKSIVLKQRHGTKFGNYHTFWTWKLLMFWSLLVSGFENSSSDANYRNK